MASGGLSGKRKARIMQIDLFGFSIMMKRDMGLCRSDETEVLVGWRFVPETTRLDQVRFAKDGLLTLKVSNTETMRQTEWLSLPLDLAPRILPHYKYAPSRLHRGAHPNK